jgi:hypothetical protein
MVRSSDDAGEAAHAVFAAAAAERCSGVHVVRARVNIGVRVRA